MNEAGFLLDSQEALIGANLIRHRKGLEEFSSDSLDRAERSLRAASYAAKVAADRLAGIRASRRSSSK